MKSNLREINGEFYEKIYDTFLTSKAALEGLWAFSA